MMDGKKQHRKSAATRHEYDEPVNLRRDDSELFVFALVAVGRGESESVGTLHVRGISHTLVLRSYHGKRYPILDGTKIVWYRQPSTPFRFSHAFWVDNYSTQATFGSM